MELTTRQLIDTLKITKSTLYKWLQYYDDFLVVKKKGRYKIFEQNDLKILLTVKKYRDMGENTEVIKLILLEQGYRKITKQVSPQKSDSVKTRSTTSPLRFPGSKSKVLNRFHPYFGINHVEYREPFIGGGSIFFGKNKAEKNWLNDKDENIFAFFISMRDYAEELCDLVMETHPTLDLWLEKRTKTKYSTILERGFDFLFFNRTNYSGIYKANPIGGMSQQSEYPIDCRWNPVTICEKIRECSKKLQNVEISNLGFESVINKPGKDVFIILDPPYYHQGDNLYPVSMNHNDHRDLARLLSETAHNFLLTIDDCPEVRSIYNHQSFYLNQESWNYSITQKREKNKIGKELFISNFPL